MADYCLLKDIEDRFKANTFTTETLVTKKQVNSFITDNSAYIDARIRNRYVTPILESNAEAFAIVKKICILLTTSEVEDILRQGQVFNEDKKAPARDRAAKLGKQAEDLLKELEKGSTVLPNVNRVSKRFVNSNVDNNKCPVFETGKTQW